MTTILALLGNRWVRGLAVGAAFILLVFALDRCARYAMSEMQESATENGQHKERAETAHEIIIRMEKADAAAEKVRRAGGADRAQCLRDNRHPENC